MRTDSMAEVNFRDYFSGAKIHHINDLAVCAGLADSGAAVDGDEGEATIGGGCNFVGCVATFRDCSDLLIGLGVDNADGRVAFIGDEQLACRFRFGIDC